MDRKNRQNHILPKGAVKESIYFMAHLAYLLVLEVMYTDISDIPDSALHGMSYLTVLNLKANAITTIGNNTFTGLSHLHHLILSGNPLIQIGMFINLTSIQVLDLSQMKLAHINDVFSGASHLQKLNISHNQLSSLKLDIFSNLQSIDTLDFSHNPIQYVCDKNKNIFQALPKLTEISVVRSETCCLVTGVKCKSDILTEDNVGSCQDLNNSLCSSGLQR
jgi:hypothetical protein